MSIQLTKQQHWVPQFYLKGWSFPDEQIYCYDKITRKQFSRNVQEVAGSKWFNDTTATLDESEPEKLQVVEKLLAQVEGQCGSIFKSLRKDAELLASAYPGEPTESTPLLNGSQRKNVAMFMALQFLRTDDFRCFIRDSMNAIVQRGMEATLPIADPELNPSNFKMNVIDDEIKRMHIDMFLKFPDFAPYFFEKRWNYGINTHSRLLVTSDNPVVKIPAFPGHDGIDSFGIRIIFPVSPYMVLTLYDKRAFPERFTGIGFLTEKTVEEYNMLQLQQCRRQIYGRQNDFEFARKHCEENPQNCTLSNRRLDEAEPLIDLMVERLYDAAKSDERFDNHEVD